MRTRRVLLVGGVGDGRLEVVEDHVSHLEVYSRASLPPCLDLDAAMSEGKVPRETREQYHLAPLDVYGDRDRRWIAYPTGWTFVQAIDTLFERYEEKTAVLERHAREYGL